MSTDTRSTVDHGLVAGPEIPVINLGRAYSLPTPIAGRSATTDKELDEIRELLVLDFGCQEDWRRRKQEEYPDDKRNGEAAKCFARLESTVKDMPAELLLRYQAVWQVDDPLCVGETWSETLRQVGFYSEPASAQALVERFLAEIEPQLAERAA